MRRSLRLLAKRNKCCNVSFPEEILIEIFSRLPVKLLLQCKCLSKNWFKLISSPHFAKLHHHHHANQYNERILFASAASKPPSVILHSLDHKTYNDTDTVKYKSLCLPNNKIMVAGSCNGLVCLTDYSTFIAICNPATNENVQHYFGFDVKKLPSNYKRFHIIGFGCDPLTDTYKVVRVDAYYSADDLGYCEAHVYTLGTKEWRKIPGASRLPNNNKAPYLNGALHWFKLADSSRWTDSPRLIDGASLVSFDIGREEFLEIPWIPFSKLYRNALGLLRGCLASYAFDYYGEGATDIWLMKVYGVKQSWTKILSIPVQVERRFSEPIIIDEKGEILFARKFWLWHKEGHLYAYDPTSNTVNEYAQDIMNWFDVSTFVESLVKIPSFSGEERKKQNTTGRRRKRKAKAH